MTLVFLLSQDMVCRGDVAAASGRTVFFFFLDFFDEIHNLAAILFVARSPNVRREACNVVN